MTTLDFGGLDLVSTTGQHVEVFTRAEFSASTSFEEDLLTTLTEKDAVRRLWVSCSSNLRFELSLSFDAQWRSEADRERLSESLTTSLGKDEARTPPTSIQWTQFGLQPVTAKSFAAISNTAHQSIALSLATSSRLQETPSKRAHKLLDGGRELSGFLLPNAAQTCSLEAIHLDLHISGAASNGRDDNAETSNLTIVPTSAICDDLFGLTKALPNFEDHWAETVGGGDIDDILLDGHHVQDGKGEQVLLASHAKGRLSCDDLLLLPENSSRLESDDTTVDEMSQMVVTAIGGVVQGESYRCPADVEVQHKPAFKSLAHVAPAVFIPTCLPFIANRAVFLPTIEHAISCMDTRSRPFVSPTLSATDGSNKPGPGVQFWQLLQDAARIEARKYRPRRHESSRTALRSGLAKDTELVGSSQESWQTAEDDLDIDEGEEEEDLLDGFVDCAATSEGLRQAIMNDKFGWPSSTMSHEDPHEDGLQMKKPSTFDTYEYQDDQTMLDI